MKPTRNIEEAMRNRFSVAASRALHDRVLDRVRQADAQSKESTPVGNRPAIRRMIMTSTIARLGIAAAVAAAVLIGTNMFGGSLESVAWADVQRQFEAVPFFGLTIYVGQGDAPPAKRIEIWKSTDSRMRVHDGNEVVFAGFANGNKSIVAYDRSTGKPAGANMMVQALLEAFLHPEGQFSLGTLTSTLSKDTGGLVPIEVAGSATSREIAIFQVTDKATGENLRIWALRDSKLPIQMQFRDPRNGEYGDFTFDYTQKEDPTFFDPDAFVRQPGK